MRPIALSLAAFLAFTLATPGSVCAQDLGIRRPPGAQASEEPQVNYGREGVYAVVAGTYGAEDLSESKDDIERELNDKVDFSNSLGFNVRAGYRWHPNLALELQFEWLDEYQLENTALAEASLEGLWSLTANAKGYISTGRFQPFIICGLGLYDAGDASTENTVEELPEGSAFGVRAGAGIDFYVSENFALSVEGAYNFATADLDDLRYTSLSWGVLFKP